jgi:uncharacterized protein (TIGR00369 family)
MHADERFANPAGVLQGGFVTALADAAMGAATITHLQGEKTYSANVELKMSFVRPATIGSTLTATGEVVGGGTRVLFCECTISDDAGRLVAKASSTYLLTPREATHAAE